MKYSIVYSSKTGNTTLLASKIKEILPLEDCVYYGAPDEKALDADLIFIGSGIYKGVFDESSMALLKKINNKKVFLFGTAGFGKSEAYFENVFERVQVSLNDSNTVVGKYMCQGKMPIAVRQRYESMLDKDPEKIQMMIENFDQALCHPSTEDLDCLEAIISKSID